MNRIFSRFAVLLGALLVAATLQLSAQTAATGAQSTAHPHHTMPKPTNLQVLPKDISGPDLIALMRGYTQALGVECGFCHASNPQTGHPDFASDTNPEKTIARTMIAMTSEINAKYLSTVKDPDATPADKTVTCGTCHRGRSMPEPFDGAGAEHQDMPAKQ